MQDPTAWHIDTKQLEQMSRYERDLQYSSKNTFWQYLFKS